MYHLTQDQLLQDLHVAFMAAKRHKSQRGYVKYFEQHLERNLQVLCEELWDRTYKARPSTCFIITDPKKREVFAADFRDRIVHHLYYNYTHELFERTFIHDSYSCITLRGTHYGIERMQHHIRQESLNYTFPCYVLKMDIRGYFMHINRAKLLDICLKRLRQMAMHRVMGGMPVLWQDRIDFEFVEYLTREIIMLDPTSRCIRKGSVTEWVDLPHDKSLFHSPAGCGLPIGNLTSQLFSNIYLNELDQYMKRVLHCRHYGRYVDDFYVVSADKEYLRTLVSPVREYLCACLELSLHEGKVAVLPVQFGVQFLGMYLKPWRKTISRQSGSRMLKKWNELSGGERWNPYLISRLVNSTSSFRGILSHGYNGRLKKVLEI